MEKVLPTSARMLAALWVKADTYNNVNTADAVSKKKETILSFKRAS